MEVILAGYNLDTQTIKTLIDNGSKIHPTPETISAAYARISRDSRTIPELRKIAIKEVDKARKSNEKIIFDMGHSSIAEHVVFNIDVIGVSRYLVEEIEKNRLCSFTEKSQRYVLFDNDFVIPSEIEIKKNLKERYIETIRLMQETYFQLYEKLRPYFFEKHKEMAKDKENEKVIEGWAKEDARYIIALATQTQLGMTVNARSLERMIAKCASSKISEVREFSGKLYEVTSSIAPSVIKHTKPTDYYLKTTDEIKNEVSKYGGCHHILEPVKLVYNTANGDDLILASLIHSNTDIDMENCLKRVREMKKEEKEEIFKKTFKHMKSYNPVLREFENANFIFELVISSSCFAQLKRHRLATITTKNYDPSLGTEIPQSIVDIGMKDDFIDVIKNVENMYKEISLENKSTAPYILTNAHKRKVLMNINVREMYHFARLREDAHAQWDIRYIAQEILKLAKEKMPLSLTLACGKDMFENCYKEIFR